MAKKNLGDCPVCGREMIAGASVDRHHWIPRAEGGQAQSYVHRVCHRKLHSLWTPQQLGQEFSDPAKVRAHPDMAGFLKWVRKQPPEFYDNSRTAKDWGRRS